MKLLDEYLSLKQRIYDYFGFEESWMLTTIEDSRQYLWKIEDDSIVFKDGNNYYDELIISSYPGDEYTMFIVDTMTDGNIISRIFDNSKKMT